jgi:hypothetical protein
MLSCIADDPSCVEHFSVLVSHIVNNELPASAKAMLTSSSLVALGKKGGGVRPIAIGELFYRISAQYTMCLVSSSIKAAVGPNQYGVQTPNGAAQIIQSIQHLLQEDGIACLSIDMANAFNSLERSAIFRALYSEEALQPLWRITQFGYTDPSFLLLRERSPTSENSITVFESRNGVRQGDPLSALLFSLAVRDVFHEAGSLCEKGDFDYVDDANFVGTPDSLATVLQSIKPKLAEIGLRVNDSKCILTCFSDLTPEQLKYWSDSNIPVNTKSTCMLGAAVGREDQDLIDCLTSETNEWSSRRAALYRRLPLLSVQNRMYVLRHMHASSINHQLACLPPQITATHAKSHDQMMIQAATQALALDAPVSLKLTSQLMLPLSKGGFGLLSASATAAPAYLSSVFNTLTHATPFTNYSDGSIPLPSGTQIYSFIQKAIDGTRLLSHNTVQTLLATSAPFHNQSDNDILPCVASEFVSFYSSKRIASIQASLTLRTSNLIYHALVTEVLNREASPSRNCELGRLQSILADESHRWLTVTPHDRSLRLTDEEYRICAKFRLGARITGIQDLSVCPCCKKRDAFTIDPWHYLSCASLISTEGTARHNNISLQLKHSALNGGCYARYEPRDLSQDDNKRPDVELFTLPVSTLIDVVVSNPIAPSHAQSAIHHPLAVADQAAKKKCKKYQEMAAFQNAKFSPFACETLGGISRSAKQVVGLISDITVTNCSWLPKRTVMNDLLDVVAIHIQRGNASMVRAGELQRRIASRQLSQ